MNCDVTVIPDSILADALSPNISITNVRSVSGGRFLPGNKEFRVGAAADETGGGGGGWTAGGAVVGEKMPPLPEALIGKGVRAGCGGGGGRPPDIAEGLGNLLRRLALASGRTMRKEALPL